ATAQAAAELFPNARWPDDSYQRWSAGGVDFFLCDSRRYRDDVATKLWLDRHKLPYRSSLGLAQTAWLKQGLQQSTARLKVVFLPMTLTWDQPTGGGNQVSHEEWQSLTSFCNALPGTVLWLSGDRHICGVMRKGNVVEACAAPMAAYQN